MMNRRGAIGALAGVMTFALGGCGGNSASYRFRMTVEVETPEGLKTGSSVMEVHATRGYRIGDRSGSASALLGEAIILDLPGRPVFVLLRGCEGCGALQGAVTDALLHHRPGEKRTGDFIDDVNALHGWFSSSNAELPRQDWPLMVRFRDINDPRSVERVDPQAIGVTRIVVETTGDEVTTGIEKRFPPWFVHLAESGARFDGDNSIAVLANPATDAGQFAPGDFSTIYKVER